MSRRYSSYDSTNIPCSLTLEHLDQDQLQSYKEAFESFDSNHNGKVSSSNLKANELIKHNLKSCNIYLIIDNDREKKKSSLQTNSNFLQNCFPLYLAKFTVSLKSNYIFYYLLPSSSFTVHVLTTLI